MIYAEIENKKFDNRTILNHLNLKISDNDFTILMGESGCGKTTLFNIIAGIDKNFIGNVQVNTNYSMIFQKHMLLEMLTIYENLKIVNQNVTEQEIESLLVKFGIINIKHNRLDQCSVGELQRVMIARAILSGSKLILADEPTSALDYMNTKKIMEIFKQLNEEGYTVFLITHSINCASYGKKVLLLNNGKITDELQLSENINSNSNKIYTFIDSKMNHSL